MMTKISKTSLFLLLVVSGWLFGSFFASSASATALMDGIGPPVGPPPPTATFTANGTNFVVANVGDTVSYVWSSTNADSATSTYTVDSQDACGGSGTGPFPWAASTLSGSTSGVVAACQAGHTYTITYTVKNTAGDSDSATVTILVSDGSPAPVVSVSATPASFAVGGSATLSWSVVNGYTTCTATGFSASPLPSGSQTISPASPGIYTYSLSCTGKGGIGSSTQTVYATDASPPVIGIQLSDDPGNNNSTVSAGCLVSNNGIQRFTPAGGGTSPGAGDSNYFEEKCGQIYLPSAGPFITTDFQIGIRLGASAGGTSCDPAVMTGATNFSYGPWAYTPWASQAGSGGSWSLWTSDNIGNDVDCYQLVVNTRPLAAGTALTNVRVGLQFGNGGNIAGPSQCQQPPSQVGWPVFTSGGWSSSNPNPGTAGVAGTNGPGWTPGYDTTDCAQVFLGAGTASLPTSNLISGSAAGSINVTSENSQVTSTLVNASWSFVGPDDPCATAACSGTQQTYTNQATGTYTIVPGTAPVGYALRSIKKEEFLANRPKDFFGNLFAFVKDALVSIAKAVSVNLPGQTLAANSSINFIIYWDPVAELGIAPTSVSVSDTSPNGTITITNPGSPGSTLNWSAAAPSYGAGASGWLTVPASGSVLAGASQNITATASTGGIAAGSCTSASPCTATVTFSGTSLPGGANLTTVTTVTITLTMGAGGSVAVTVNSPTPVAAGVPAQVSCSGGTGSYTWSSTGSPTFSATSGTPVTVTYSTPGTYSLTCTDSGGASGSTSITIAPDCTISASPTSVVPPQQSTLTWSCTAGTATSCTINGQATFGGASVGTGGSASVSPTQNATYVLSCTANNGLGSAIPQVFATVTVRGPGVHETNP